MQNGELARGIEHRRAVGGGRWAAGGGQWQVESVSRRKGHCKLEIAKCKVQNGAGVSTWVSG